MQEAVQGAPIISARQLRVQYGDREILHGLDFDIHHGETVVILGGSGSGKSTLLRTIVGLRKTSLRRDPRQRHRSRKSLEARDERTFARRWAFLFRAEL